MQRLVDALPKKDIVDITVTLKQLDPGDLPQGLVHLLRSSGRDAVDTIDPDIELALRLPFLKNLQYIGVAARHAGRGKTRSIHVFDHGPAAGLKLFRRDLGKSRSNGASGRDVALDHPGRPSGGVAFD